jgi:hypothetical protein
MSGKCLILHFMCLQKAHSSQSLFRVKVQFLVNCVAATEESNQFVVLSVDTVVVVTVHCSISVKFCKPSSDEGKESEEVEE